MTGLCIKRLGNFKLLSANFNPKNSVEPEKFPIFQHKVEWTPHFTRVTEVRHIHVCKGVVRSIGKNWQIHTTKKITLHELQMVQWIISLGI